MLNENVFPGWPIIRNFLHIIYIIVELLIWPCLWSLSGLLSLYIPLSTELQHPRNITFRKWTLTLPYLVLLLCTLPVALITGIVRVVLQKIRGSYIYVHSVNSYTATDVRRHGKYGIASINTCLFPDAPSRYNNLSQPYNRAKSIGERIVVDQYFYGDNKKQTHQNSFHYNLRTRNHIIPTKTELNGTVESHFPELDFLCFQEVWQRCYARPLIAQLKKVYPYILHDVGYWSFGCNYWQYNSGLLFASRYEILDVDFKPFKNKCNYCVINSKGVLMVKVLLQKPTQRGGKRDVGYIFLTHLQAYQGTKNIVDKQLDQMVPWIEEFRHTTHCDSDNVKLDCVTGDFNFDNMSPCDRDLYSHRLFDIYDDPCREKAGLDKPWAVGTEFRQDTIWDTHVLTPAGLCSALRDPLQLQRYMVGADLAISNMESIVYTKPKVDAHGNIIPTPKGGRRRVDYVLHRKNLAKVTQYNFVSRLATLSDHIPVAMVMESLSSALIEK